MSHEGRVSRNSPGQLGEAPSRSGVASAAGGLAPVNQLVPIAFVTTFDRPEIVTRIEVGDPDAFDDDGCLVYQAGDA